MVEEKGTDQEIKKERKRKYDYNRYHKNRNEAIARLGGECANCGETERLDFDHIDPATKDPSLRKGGQIFTWKEERRERELAKCQLLCKSCHIRKIRLERTGSEEIQHGKYSTYVNHCRGSGCTPCKNAASEYWYGWYWSKKEQELEEWLLSLMEEQEPSRVLELV